MHLIKYLQQKAIKTAAHSGLDCVRSTGLLQKSPKTAVLILISMAIFH